VTRLFATTYRVEPSEKLDALCLVNLLSDDPFAQAKARPAGRGFLPELAQRDIVPLQEKMLGFPLKYRSITVYLVHFAFGYNSFEGLLEEGVVKVLDQFIAERLAIAVPAAERWRKNDQGLHVIAAALYEGMGEDRYDRTGGNAAAYLRDAGHVRRIVAALDRIAVNGL